MGKINSIALEITYIKDEIRKNLEYGVKWHKWKSVYINDDITHMWESIAVAGVEYSKEKGFIQAYARRTNNNLIEFCFIDECTEHEFEDYMKENSSLKYILLYDADVNFLSPKYLQ